MKTAKQNYNVDQENKIGNEAELSNDGHYVYTNLPPKTASSSERLVTGSYSKSFPSKN